MELPALVQKKRRLEIVRNMIKAQGEVEYDKFVAMIELNIGLSPDNAKAYLKTLKDLGDISIESGFIRPILKTASETEIQKESKKIDELYDAFGHKVEEKKEEVK